MADDPETIPYPDPPGWFTRLLMRRTEDFRRRALMGDNFQWRIIAGMVVCGVGDFVLIVARAQRGAFWWVLQVALNTTFTCFILVGILTAFKRAVEYRCGYFDGRTAMMNAMKEAHERGMNPYAAVEREAMRDLAKQGISMEALEDFVTRIHGEPRDSDG